jgi:hypothetical protein
MWREKILYALFGFAVSTACVELTSDLNAQGSLTPRWNEKPKIVRMPIEVQPPYNVCIKGTLLAIIADGSDDAKPWEMFCVERDALHPLARAPKF